MPTGISRNDSAVGQIDFGDAVLQIENDPKTRSAGIERETGGDGIGRFAFEAKRKAESTATAFNFPSSLTRETLDRAFEVGGEKLLAVAAEDDAGETARNRRAAVDFLRFQIDEQNLICGRARPASVGRGLSPRPWDGSER